MSKVRTKNKGAGIIKGHFPDCGCSSHHVHGPNGWEGCPVCNPESKYFISAESMQRAMDMARERGIPWPRCIYIPHNEPYRWERIAGHHRIPRDHLIGAFDEDEIFYLTR